MTAPEFTVAQIEEAVRQAIKDRELEVIPGLITLMARQDPERALVLFDTLKLGIDVATALLEFTPAGETRCRVCGCTDADCHECIARTGEPCSWVEPDLCSACTDPPTKPTKEHH